MDAAPNTQEGDELDVLATLADAYEAKHHTVEAPDPIAESSSAWNSSN